MTPREKEAELIRRSKDGPVTIASLVMQLRAIGVTEGMTLIVHASLSSIGWVCGGAQAVVMALEEALTTSGTLVMPTYTGWNSDPAGWGSPPIPADWIEIIRDQMPAYDPCLSVTKSMGAIPECFRGQKEVTRSPHPRASFSAWGRDAAKIVSAHPLDFPFGENSPLARAYDADARVLMIGVTYDTINSWYLSVRRAGLEGLPVETCRAVVMENGLRVWKSYRDDRRKHDDFDAIGADFEKTGVAVRGRIGYAEARLIPQRTLVDFGVEWMRANRFRGGNP